MTPRIAVVLHYFPSATRPHRGMQFVHQMKAMSALADLRVFVVEAEYPRSKLLQPRRFLTTRLAPAPGMDWLDVKYITYPTLPVVGRPWNGTSCAKQLIEPIRAAEPDLILAYHVYPEASAALSVGRELNVPVVVGCVGSDLCGSTDPITRRMVRDTLRNASFVLTKSDHLRRKAIELGASPQNVQTVLNGCDSDLFHPDNRKAARIELGIEPDAELVLFVGNLVAVKGLPNLIEALSLLRRSRPDVQLALIGQGPLQDSLHELSSRMNCAKQVRFLGPGSPKEIARWLAASNLFCLPSYSEGCPNVVLEALSCGRPVVGSAVGGVPELVDTSCGRLVSPGRPQELALALSEVLEQPWDEQMIAKRFRRSWKDMASETVEACISVSKGGMGRELQSCVTR